MKGIEIVYEEVPLSNVMEYYSDDFKPKEGKITSCEYFIDTAKGTVIFKLWVDKGE